MTEGFYPLTIVDVRRETADSVSLRLQAPEAFRSLFDFSAGQHLTLRSEFDGEDVRRNYSLCAAPHEGELRIAVKEIAGGRFSTFANSALKTGDVIEVMPPHGSFTWTFAPGASRRYLAFAGGSGITPILSLMKTALHREPGSAFTLFYGNRSTPTVMFLEELAGLKNRYLDRLEIYHFLEDEAEEIELFNGRLDAAKTREALDRLVDVSQVDAVFICGPGPMMDAVESALLERGAPREKILIERFTVGRPSAGDVARAELLQQKAAGLSLEVTLDGRRLTIDFDPARGAILDNARAAGLPAPFACKGGVCATCRARVLSGKVEMKVNYGLSEAEVTQGYVLTCQAVPTSEGVAISYDA